MTRDQNILPLVVLFLALGRPAPAEAPGYVTERMIERCRIAPTADTSPIGYPLPSVGETNPPAPDTGAPGTAPTATQYSTYLTPRQLARASVRLEGVTSYDGRGTPGIGGVLDAIREGREELQAVPPSLLPSLAPARDALSPTPQGTSPYGASAQALVARVRAEASRRGATPTDLTVRVVAEELAKLAVDRPEHVFAKDPVRAIRLLLGESMLCPTARNRSSGALGLWQFLPSTARLGGYTMSRLRGTSEADQRYQMECGLDWAGKGGSGWVRAQWAADPGPTR